MSCTQQQSRTILVENITKCTLSDEGRRSNAWIALVYNAQYVWQITQSIVISISSLIRLDFSFAQLTAKEIFFFSMSHTFAFLNIAINPENHNK